MQELELKAPPHGDWGNRETYSRAVGLWRTTRGAETMQSHGENDVIGPLTDPSQAESQASLVLVCNAADLQRDETAPACNLQRCRPADKGSAYSLPVLVMIARF